jgi:hypothetical protein
MASYHCSVKAGPKGKAAAHAQYIAREGKYSEGERFDDLESSGEGNLPKWAEHDSSYFWKASDDHERANGTAYREIVVALPRELTPDQRHELMASFVSQELGEKHAYKWAIHKPDAAIEGDEQPHGHLMYCERESDGIERDPEQYFKRYNAKAPERGGCRKIGSGKKPAERAAELVELRERWATLQNEHLQRAGHDVQVDHRSLKDQGIDREPERHLGPKQARNPQNVAALLERRAAEGELERAQREVTSLIDVSGDLSAALAAREQQQRREDLRQRIAQIEAERATQANQVKPVNPLELLDDRTLKAEFEQLARMGAPAELAEKRPDVVAARKLAADTAAAEQAAKEAASKAMAAAREWEEKHYLRALLKVGNEAERLRQEHASQTAAAEKLGREHQRAAHAADTLAKTTTAEIAAVQAEPRARLATISQEKERREAVRTAQIQAIQKHLSARTPGMQTFEVQYARTLKGVVVLDTPEHVVVQVSRATTFAHPRKSFGGNPPKVGQSVQIRHDETGNATWTPAKLDLGQVLGLGGGGRGR